jgi:hypothetical protein
MRDLVLSNESWISYVLERLRENELGKLTTKPAFLRLVALMSIVKSNEDFDVISKDLFTRTPKTIRPKSRSYVDFTNDCELLSPDVDD